MMLSPLRVAQPFQQVHHVLAERDVLALAHTDWVIDLKYTFMDKHFL